MTARAGQMRERVTLQAETRTTDAGGGASTAWANIGGTATVWARVEPLRGDERMQAMQTDARTTHRVTIRHRDGVSAKQRMKWRSTRYLYPVGPWLNEDEHRRFLTTLCREDTD